MSRYGYLSLGAGRFRERFGLSFEDITVGMRISHRPGIDISQQDNQDEALDLTNNAHLHFDSHYASKTEWGSPLFVSTITIQRLFGMISRSWYRRRAIIGIENIALTKPLFGGDTLYAQTTVLSVESGADQDVGIVRLEIEGHNREAEVIARMICAVEIYRAGRHPEDRADLEIAEQQRFCLYHEGPEGALVEQTGIWFEDMVEGETFVHWPGHTISAEASRTHALRSLEINPRWHDTAYLASHPLIAPAVFEPLVIGVVTALTTRTMGRVVANLGWTNIRLPQPVRPGQTLYAESTILALRPSRSRPDQGLAKVETRAFDETGALVCSYERDLLIYRRDMGPYSAAGY
jgi:itaconyl-CoA hydratase